MSRQPDDCSELLKIQIEKAVYDTYQEQQPSFVATIGQLLKKGALPSQIELAINKRIPTGSQLGNHAYLIASYIIRRKCSQN